MFAISERDGARLTLFTVMSKVLLLLSVPSEAETTAKAVPASSNPGARWTTPAALTVAYVGPETLEKVIASPSGSVAWSVCSAVLPSSTVMLDG